MARFKLVDCQIKTVHKPGSSNDGKKYLLANMINLNCPRSQSPRYTSFYEPYVNQLIPFISTANGGTAATEQPIPDELGVVTGAFVEYKPATRFHKRHLNDHAEQGIKAGDLVSINGVPRTYDALIVFCEYYMDELGVKSWVTGGNPIEAGERAFGNYCVPVSTSVTPAMMPTTAPEDNKLPPMPGQQQLPEGYEWREINGVSVPMPIAR